MKKLNLDNPKQTKQERYHEKNNLVLSWIKADLKELLKRLGNGSISL